MYNCWNHVWILKAFNSLILAAFKIYKVTMSYLINSSSHTVFKFIFVTMKAGPLPGFLCSHYHSWCFGTGITACIVSTCSAVNQKSNYLNPIVSTSHSLRLYSIHISLVKTSLTIQGVFRILFILLLHTFHLALPNLPINKSMPCSST